MIKKTLDKLLRHRHFWRDTGFDELSELYIAMMMRSIAVSQIGLFVPIFLYGLGFSVAWCLYFYAIFFATRFVMDIVAAYGVARFGPKHIILSSYVLQIAASLLLLTLPTYNWPLWLLASTLGSAFSLFFVAYHVEFSKIKHSKYGGKEIGYMNIVEKIGVACGPVIGGIVATLFGPQYSFLVAALLLFAGLVPLFQTREPVRTKQTLRYKDLPVEKLSRDFFSMCMLGVENVISMLIWPFFVGVFVFSSGVYFKIGIISAIGVLCGVLSAWFVGRIVDDKHGRAMLRFSTTVNALIHLVRPFVNTFGAVLGINIVNDITTVGYRIPYAKGVYDRADSLPGLRIVYISSLEALNQIPKVFVFCFLGMLATIVGGKVALITAFVIAAIASLLIMTEKFKALDPPKSI